MRLYLGSFARQTPLQAPRSTCYMMEVRPMTSIRPGFTASSCWTLPSHQRSSPIHGMMWCSGFIMSQTRPTNAHPLFWTSVTISSSAFWSLILDQALN